MWVQQGSNEMNYWQQNFELTWTEGGVTTVLAIREEKKDIENSKYADWKSDKPVAPNIVTMTVAVVTDAAITKFGNAKCSCCALCLAQNKNGATEANAVSWCQAATQWGGSWGALWWELPLQQAAGAPFCC